NAASISREINPDGRKIICEAFKLKGVKEESVSLLLNSITESTLKQYNKPIVDWYYFCKSQDLNLYKPTEGQVADWMSGKFHQGASYSSLNTCRSALSLICGEYIGQSSLLSRLLKGIYKEKPSKPKYNKIYSLDPVINKLEQMSPLSVLSLPELTNKLLMSMALITAHRKQTLSLIKRSNIKKVQNGYEIQIPDFIKTSRRGHHQPLLILPRFPENKNLCVASMLEAYLKVTSDLLINDKIEALFITTRQPFRAASKDSLSRWLKMFLFNCGISSEYTPHSIRHASTSSALAKGVDFS
ncbi:GSCOCG00005294001-RA-CDS, partial [Cotesia congregata]